MPLSVGGEITISGSPKEMAGSMKKCRRTVAHDTLSTWSVQWGLNLEGGRSIGDERIFWGPKSS